MSLVACCCQAMLPAAEPAWQSLFNGRDLNGWDTWLGPRSSGYQDPATSTESAIGLNRDPLGVFTVVTNDGAPAIHISGQVFGAITTKQEYDNVHIRVEYKWGEKKWPPRHEAKHYRDSGILYWCVGEHGAGIPAELLSHVPAEPADEAGFKPLFGADARDGWAQCGPGYFTVTNGVASAHGGMGLWWHTNRMFTNFVLRGEWRMENRESDTGVFVRFPNPGNDPWIAVRQGHEMEIGDDPEGKDNNWRTGALYPFCPPARVPTRPIGEWNSYELICIVHHYSVRINGELVTTWTDPKRRTTHGYVGLQNYQEGKNTQHRNLRIKELP